MTCLQFRSLLDRYVDQELSAGDKQSADDHLRLVGSGKPEAFLSPGSAEDRKCSNPEELRPDGPGVRVIIDHQDGSYRCHR